MKIQNTGLDNVYAMVRGWVSDVAAAATGLISVTDQTTGTTVSPVSSMTLIGQLLHDGGGGNLVVDIQAVLTDYTNNSGVDLVAGDVVVVDSSADLSVTTTTTAQDTRPVGIVLGHIGAGGVGPVQTGGVIQSINVNASVTRGQFAETYTVAKQATQNATRRTGSFGIYLESGTTPAVLLFGIPDSSSIGTNAELNIEGGQDVIKPHGNMGATETFDPTDGNVHTGTLNANCVFTLNVPSGSGASTLEIQTTQDGTGGWVITWPGSVTWLGGTPTISTAAATVIKYLLESLDGGTTWLGVMVGGGLTSASFATPAIVLGTAAAAGSASTAIRSDSTIVAFDATVPTSSAEGDAAATGSSAHAARRDHLHGRESFATPTIVLGSAAAGGAATTPIRSDATIAAFTTTLPSADGTAATGSAAFAARIDHVHPGSASTNDHLHIVGEYQTGNGSATVFTMANEAIPGTVAAYNVAGARVNVTLGGMNDQITFDTQPGTGTFYYDYIPLQA